MGKERKSKRQLIRDEKRAKKRAKEVEEEGERVEIRETKRRRTDAPLEAGADYIPLDDGEFQADGERVHKRPDFVEEKEFFGMLADEEQEYFRHADEMLELNDFPSTEDRDLFLQNVFKEAVGKELKIASSQSCSRLMERLILLSTSQQKKRLFEAFATHFVTLVTHRFAGHCCEKLFLYSASIVTTELTGDIEEDDQKEEGADASDEKPQSMETLFLLTLDELGEHLSALLSDRYASHALRVLLMVLSGRPLDRASTKSLLQSKKKEYITVPGAPSLGDDSFTQPRVVPSSFTWAVQKIILDVTNTMDSTALRVLATHPTGNPVLQLLLELDMSTKSKGKAKKSKDAPAEDETEAQGPTLLEKLLPDAPTSFAESGSEASIFVNSMLYDPIGSRLLETVISHCPGKLFKGLYAHQFGSRIHTLLRNEIACYPAIQVLNRLSKEDLASAVEKSLSEVPLFVEKGRFNVLKTLFERCHTRQAPEEIDSLLKALVSASGKDWKHLVPKLCFLNDDEPKRDDGQKFQKDVANKAAMTSHGSQLVVTLLGIPGVPAKAIQASLQALTSDQVIHLATSTPNTASILTKALTTPSQNPQFHKILVSKIASNVAALTESRQGQDVLNAVIAAPSKSEGISVPFHLKENIMSQLASRESTLRDTWIGRNIWRTWKGDLWNHRRFDWVRWAKETDAESARFAKVPAPKHEQAAGAHGKAKKFGPAQGGQDSAEAVAA